MSYITIHVYDGDSETFDDHDESGTIGARIDGETQLNTSPVRTALLALLEEAAERADGEMWRAG